LDTENERLVQAAIESTSQGRTTIIIAHRLSTIKNADLIVVMDKGIIVEVGTHEQLITLNGSYASLVKGQQVRTIENTAQNGSASNKGKNVQETKISLPDPVHDNIISARKNLSTVVPTDEEVANIKEAHVQQPTSFSRVFKLNSPEWSFLLVGSILAIVNGLIIPIFSLIFSEILQVLTYSDRDKLRKDANFWSLMFVALAGAVLLVHIFKMGFFGIASERLTRRIRFLCFSALVRQEIAYFDLDSNTTGSLLNKLADDAGQVQCRFIGELLNIAFSSGVLSTLIESCAAAIAGVAISFTYSWRMALVVLASSFLIVFAAIFQLAALQLFYEKAKHANEITTNVACECIRNIKTVATLGKESMFYERFAEGIREPRRLGIKGAILSNVGLGFVQAFQFFAFARKYIPPIY
jgi:ABC-type multidrug transport system fused ATPase/permease subunit